MSIQDQARALYNRWAFTHGIPNAWEQLSDYTRTYWLNRALEQQEAHA